MWWNNPFIFISKGVDHVRSGSWTILFISDDDALEEINKLHER